MGTLGPVPLVNRAGSILRPLLNAVLPTHPIPVTVLSGPARGLKIVIEPQREKSYWAGTHERAVQTRLVDIVEPGMTVWDIGAHTGFFSALCSRRVGLSGRVHSFEPGLETRTRLERTIRLNGFENVQVHACAVGPERREGVLYDVGRSAQATLRPLGTRASGSNPIEVHTLSDLWDELGPPDVIKIDAEGAEAGIIESGAEVLETASVSLVVEMHNDDAVARILELFPEDCRDQIDDQHWALRGGGTPDSSA
jgi:FkbM family methyltransferase